MTVEPVEHRTRAGEFRRHAVETCGGGNLEFHNKRVGKPEMERRNTER